jgi:hypothetical protein
MTRRIGTTLSFVGRWLHGAGGADRAHTHSIEHAAIPDQLLIMTAAKLSF